MILVLPDCLEAWNTKMSMAWSMSPWTTVLFSPLFLLALSMDLRFKSVQYTKSWYWLRPIGWSISDWITSLMSPPGENEYKSTGLLRQTKDSCASNVYIHVYKNSRYFINESFLIQYIMRKTIKNARSYFVNRLCLLFIDHAVRHWSSRLSTSFCHTYWR